MGHLQKKTRSPELRIEKHSTGHIFASIIIKLYQDAWLGYNSNELEHGLSRMNNKVTGAKNRKAFLTI
jgi:hypothetical protein